MKNLISVSSVHKSQIVFFAHLTVLRLITTVWGKNWNFYYLSVFRAQVSQIVLSAHFFILRLITIVWAKTWKLSYLRKFSSQVTQIVSSARLPVLRLITFVRSKECECSAQVSQFVFSAHLTIFRFIITQVKLQKSHISVSSVHKYRKSCSLLIRPFYGFLQLYEVKTENSNI